MKPFTIIVCVDRENGIGCTEGIPWRESEDMKRFTRVTKGMGKNAVIMGRKTWESIPEKNKPLKGRLNIVMTRSDISCDAVICKNFNEALANAGKSDNIFVIGGGEIYREAIAHPLCARIERTVLNSAHNCDTFFPNIPPEFSSKIDSAVGQNGILMIHEYHNRAEEAYLALMKEVLSNPLTPNRTGEQTRQSFASTLKYPLIDSWDNPIIPLITTKKMAWKTCLRELLWFLSGSPDASQLPSKGVKIWTGNTSREFLDSRGLQHLPEGSIGPGGYGPSWRHFGGNYDTAANSMDGGIDQIQNVIDSIKTDPSSRRHLVTAWNPSRVDEAALPPCHFSFVFNVEFEDDVAKYLNCHVMMRSNDLFLGHPFNVASYGFLTHMIARICGLRAKTVAISATNAHIYANHEEAVKTQISRKPIGFPKISFSDAINDRANLTIDDFDDASFIIHDYYPADPIKAEMVV